MPDNFHPSIYKSLSKYLVFITLLLIACSDKEIIENTLMISIDLETDSFYHGSTIPIKIEVSGGSIPKNEAHLFINNKDIGFFPVAPEIYYWDTKDAEVGKQEVKVLCKFSDNTTLESTYYIELLEISTNCPSSVEDIDGNSYSVIQIGNQCWMQSNLKTTRYADGGLLINGIDSLLPQNTTEPPYWFFAYDRQQTNADTYGYLYSFFSVTRAVGNFSNKSIHIKGICPTDWHLPSIDEWKQLINQVGGLNNAGRTLRSNPERPNGFNALMGGTSFAYLSKYIDKDISAYFWTSTPSIPRHSYHIYMNKKVKKASIFSEINSQKFGMSVRCIKD